MDDESEVKEAEAGTPAPVVKSPQEVAKEKHEAEEARLKAQAPFDPKVHGVGTMPVEAPDSVAQLYKLVVTLGDRVRALETQLRRYSR